MVNIVKCGICDESNKESEMIATNKVRSGYICKECYESYYDEFVDNEDSYTCNESYNDKDIITKKEIVTEEDAIFGVTFVRDIYSRLAKDPEESLAKDIEKSLNIAIKAMEKVLIPKPVNVELSEYHKKHGDDFYNKDRFNCPSCNRRLRNKQKDPYCPRCAQALDWSIITDDN